jgi:hypothetical protein
MTGPSGKCSNQADPGGPESLVLSILVWVVAAFGHPHQNKGSTMDTPPSSRPSGRTPYL